MKCHSKKSSQAKPQGLRVELARTLQAPHSQPQSDSSTDPTPQIDRIDVDDVDTDLSRVVLKSARRGGVPFLREKQTSR